jgi:hypothetical protein
MVKIIFMVPQKRWHLSHLSYRQDGWITGEYVEGDIRATDMKIDDKTKNPGAP